MLVFDRNSGRLDTRFFKENMYEPYFRKPYMPHLERIEQTMEHWCLRAQKAYQQAYFAIKVDKSQNALSFLHHMFFQESTKSLPFNLSHQINKFGNEFMISIEHGLWTPNEAFFSLKSRTFGLVQTNWAEQFQDIWDIFG